MAARFATIDEYIDMFPDEVRSVLGRVRQTILDAVPDAGERISYQMPTMTLAGRNLVHFAAWREHLSLYPIPRGSEDFQREIAPYVAGKGTVRFPLSEPIPYDLIARLVTHLADER